MIIQVRIEETLSKIIEVEADNNIDAVSKVAKQYAQGEIVLMGDDCIDTKLYIERKEENA